MKPVVPGVGWYIVLMNSVIPRTMKNTPMVSSVIFRSNLRVVEVFEVGVLV